MTAYKKNENGRFIDYVRYIFNCAQKIAPFSGNYHIITFKTGFTILLFYLKMITKNKEKNRDELQIFVFCFDCFY